MTEPDATGPPTRPARPWCLFHSGSQPFAVGLESVAEVVEVDRLVRLPHGPPEVLGLCTLRREVVPVVALGRPREEAAGHGSLVLILKSPSGPWGLSASCDGTMLAEEPLEPTGGGEGFTLGTVRRGTTAHAAIDPEAAWRTVRESVERWYAEHWDRLTPVRLADSPPTSAAARRGRP